MASDAGMNEVHRVSQAAGLTRLYSAYIESPMQVTLRRRYHISGAVWQVARLFIRVLSLGRVDPSATDYVIVLERPVMATAATSAHA